MLFNLEKGKALALGVITVALLVAVLAACGGTAAPQSATETAGATAASDLSGDIQVKGSDTMVNLAGAWSEGYMDANSDANITVFGGGSGTGIAALLNGTTDIANASRPMKDEEIQTAKDAGFTPVEFNVAMDGVAVVVNHGNPIQELTMSQLADIYTGKITNWKDLGGDNAPIVVLSRDTNSGTHVFFKEHVLQAKEKEAEYGPKVQMMPSTEAGVTEVSQNPNAIFYAGLGYVDESVKLVGIKANDEAKAVLPSLETVQDGSYPVARPLFMYTAGEPEGLVKAFIDWVMGPTGQKIVEEQGFIPVPSKR